MFLKFHQEWGGHKLSNFISSLLGSPGRRNVCFHRSVLAAGIFSLVVFMCSSMPLRADQEFHPTSSQASSSISGWPVSNGIDSDMSSVWSSSLSSSPSTSQWYAFWWGSFQNINYLRLTPRMLNGAELGYPKSVTIYWSDGSAWHNFPTISNMQATSFNDTIIRLPYTVNCNGIDIVTSVLGQDNNGSYCFQMADFAAGYVKPCKVYFGCADTWVNSGPSPSTDLIENPSGWSYTAQNADGFYVNFIEMLWIDQPSRGNPDGVSQTTLNQTAALFTNKNAFFESDDLSQNTNAGDDQQAINSLQSAGFTIPYTSLNEGWDFTRANNLAWYNNAGPKRRCNLVQCGPWAIGGNITSNYPGNATICSNAMQADGLNTDGPIGEWYTNNGGMQPGTISVVNFASGAQRTSAVMICPYGANQPGYTDSMYLSQGQSEVQALENAGCEPDVWALFEYADSQVPATPEQVGGVAQNTCSGLAFWLISHLNDSGKETRLDVIPQSGIHAPSHKVVNYEGQKTEVCSVDVAVPFSPQSGQARFANASFTGGSPDSRARNSRTFTCMLSNRSKTEDFCPVIRARLNGDYNNWTATYTFDDKDVTSAMTEGGGLVCVAGLRLLPQEKHLLKITLTSTKPGSQADVTLELMPNVSRMDQIHQRIVFHAKS